MVQLPQGPAHFLPSRLGASANHASRSDELKQTSASPSASRHHGHQSAAAGHPPFTKGHQRRQSMARLLPDISKLRLLSWLVEASSELINCDIAIMDGVYAKLNRSRESMLFWQQQHQVAAVVARQAPPARPPRPRAVQLQQQQQQQQRPQPQAPPAPTVGPVAGLKQQQQLSKSCEKPLAAKQQQQQHRLEVKAASASKARRNHHSLPITNYDASSLAAVSMRSSATAADVELSGPASAAAPTTPRKVKSSQQRSAKGAAAQCASLPSDLLRAAKSTGTQHSGKRQTARGQQRQLGGEARDWEALQASDSSEERDSEPEEQQQQREDVEEETDEEDEEEADDDQSTSSAGTSSEASTSSSGIHGAASLSSSASSCASSASCANSASVLGAVQSVALEQPHLSSAEQLSERIRRSVQQHNQLQTLLVNVIRQYDRLAASSTSRSGAAASVAATTALRSHGLRVDLADLADSLDDGCLCACHSRRPLSHQLRALSLPSNQAPGSTCGSVTSSTLSLFQQSKQARKTRRKAAKGAGELEELSREEILERFPEKLCDNCFEAHFWLHSCSQFQSLELAGALGDSNRQQQQADSLNSVIALRNATFIKLVQQQARSTISQSIELIDLIRKEIKSPESIKQKQLMRCFSASVQLLTSVANYVVPAQDISTFISNELTSSCSLAAGSANSSSPAISSAGQQTDLFNLPPSDFDHSLSYPSNIACNSATSNNPSRSPTRSSPYHNQHAHSSSSSSAANLHPMAYPTNYHLAAAPEIPIRRKLHALQQLEEIPSPDASRPSDANKIKSNIRLKKEKKTTDSKEAGEPNTRSPLIDEDVRKQSSLISTNTTTTMYNPPESSSGASSNNSSTSSSIARGAVQQSSLTRAQPPSAILNRDPNTKQKTLPSHHDLIPIMSTYDTTSSLNRHHRSNHLSSQVPDDDFLAFQSTRSPKFWHSSKFNFIKKLLQVKQQRLLRQQSKDRRIYNNKIANKFRLVMMDLTHFNKSQQLLKTENGVNSLLTSMRNVLEFGLYLTVKLY